METIVTFKESGLKEIFENQVPSFDGDTRELVILNLEGNVQVVIDYDKVAKIIVNF